MAFGLPSISNMLYPESSAGSTLRTQVLEDDIDPLTGLPRVKTATDPAGTFSPLALPQPGQVPALDIKQPGGFDANAPLGSQITNKAGELALNQPQSETAGLVTQQTQDLLRKQGAAGATDAANYQQQMDDFNLQRNKDLEALRQKTGDTSNTGLNMGTLLDTALQTDRERAALSNQIKTQQEATTFEKQLKALAEGRSTVGMETGNVEAQLANLATAKGIGQTDTQNAVELEKQKRDQAFQTSLKTMDLNSQKELMNLKAQIDSGALMQTQDFDRGMEILKEQFVDAQAKGDYERQVNILNMQQQFAADQANKQKEYATAERVATEAWTSGQTFTEQQFQAAQAYLDRELERNKQSNDIMAQQYIQKKQIELQLTMQTKSMDDATKKMYLQSQLDEAKAMGDFGRETALVDMQQTYDYKKLLETQGFGAAQQDAQNKFDAAMKNAEYRQATSMQRNQFYQEAQEADKDRVIENAKIALAQQGIDASKWQTEYEAITQQEASGTAEPGAALAFLQKKLTDSGSTVTLEKTDPEDQYKAINEQFKQTQYQFLLSHPEFAVRSDAGNTAHAVATGIVMPAGGWNAETDKQAFDWIMENMPEEVSLNPTGLTAFNTFLNETVYGPAAAARAKPGTTQTFVLNGGTPVELPVIDFGSTRPRVR